jgi:hypothetical protein
MGTVTLRVNNGAGYTDHAGVKAHISKYQEQDLVENGPINVGDLRLIIPAEEIPDGVADLKQKDRIQINGRDYAVMHWDAHTRSVGDQLIAVKARVRG